MGGAGIRLARQEEVLPTLMHDPDCIVYDADLGLHDVDHEAQLAKTDDLAAAQCVAQLRRL